MPAASFRCPGCSAALSSPSALAPGKLIDCPKCRLLFAPTEDDVRTPRGRGDELALEQRWADGDLRGPYPSSSPWIGRRRRITDLGPVLQAVLIVGVGLLLTSGAALGVFAFISSLPDAPTPIATAPPLPSPRPAGLDTDTAPEPPPPARENEEPAPAPAPPAAPPATASAGSSLHGDWFFEGETFDWPGVGRAFSVAFRADGRLTIRARAGLEIESVEGGWREVSRSGSTVTLKLSLGGSVEATAEFVGGDRLRLTVGRASGMFRKT